MNMEHQELIDNVTWELIDKALSDNVLSSILVFKIKQRVDGSVEQLKACLVANNAQQIEGLNYNAPFHWLSRQYLSN